MSDLEWDKAFALEQAAEDAELLEELITIFKDSFASDMQLLREGVGEVGGAPKVCRAAHSIKGAAASLGIKGLQRVALAIEEDSRAGNLTVAKVSLAVLEEMGRELQELE